tara:strand:- start:425 stop:1618 length:1194 start_codon:yes stop_codon:yes gene_type:complete
MLHSVASGTIMAVGSGTSMIPGYLYANQQRPTENVLVVVQLSGGNDGLNTVIPYQQDEYHRSRPTLSFSYEQVLDLDGDLGFHPAMNGLHRLFEQQKLAVIQGVGYPNPNRSHFESMDIWHTCRRKNVIREEGWIGASVNTSLSREENDTPILHLGSEKQPFALTAKDPRSISIRSLDQFKLRANQKEITSVVQTSESEDSENALLGFLQSSTNAALKTSEQLIRSATQNTKENDGVDYPQHRLAQKLQTVAKLIDSPIATRVYYVTLDGFDTHAQQTDAHQALLRQLSSGLAAFQQDLSQRNQEGRVATMVFSEFGRRLSENGSKGTDHGAAGPMFLLGNKVQGGVIGDHPSLTDLQQGDLKHQYDFRQVYTSTLNWMGWDTSILGSDYKPLPLFS